MDSYTLIFVRDQRARPVQILIPKRRVRQVVAAAAIALLVGAGLAWDYWRLRADNAELADLRVETLDQREQIVVFRERLQQVDAAMSRVGELERKVRIIANLPGATGVGGAGEVTELAPEGDDVGPPLGVPVDLTTHGEVFDGQGGGQPLPALGSAVSGIDVLAGLEPRALALAADAEGRVDSLEALLAQLDDKRQRVVSMPSIM